MQFENQTETALMTRCLMRAQEEFRDDDIKLIRRDKGFCCWHNTWNRWWDSREHDDNSVRNIMGMGNFWEKLKN